MIHALTKWHLLPMPTSATSLRRIGRVHFDKCSASFFRFAGELSKELRPCRITDALCQTMIVKHPIDGQIFYADHAASVNDLATILMGKVCSLEGNTFMNTRNHAPMLAAFRCTLFHLRVFALHLCQRLLFLAKKAGVLDLFGIREGGKGFESHINAHLCRCLRKTFRLALHREAHIPFPSRGAFNRTCFKGAFDLTMVDHFDRPNLAETQAIVMGDAKARLREGETIVAISSTKAGKPWCLTRFEASEEGFECQIDTYRNILQYLRVYGREGGALFFQHRIRRLLSIARQALAFLLIGILAHLKQVVIEPTTLVQCLIELCFLFLRWVDSIPKVFDHALIIAQFTRAGNSCLNLERKTHFIPCMND